MLIPLKRKDRTVNFEQFEIDYFVFSISSTGNPQNLQFQTLRISQGQGFWNFRFSLVLPAKFLSFLHNVCQFLTKSTFFSI